MKLGIYIALLFSIFLTTVNAQQFRLSVAPEFNFPTGNASSVSGIGFGGSLKAEIGVSEHYALTASSGYNLFIGKKYLGTRIQNIEAIPTKLGLKYYSTPDFYIEGQVGAVFNGNNSAKTSLVWSPGFGTLIKTGSKKNKIDFGLRYESWTLKSKVSSAGIKSSNFGFVGLKLGYLFGL
ncbi:hypothetical protein [Pedobacter sp.]